EILDPAAGDVGLHRFHQGQVFAQRHRNAGGFQLVEEGDEHRPKSVLRCNDPSVRTCGQPIWEQNAAPGPANFFSCGSSGAVNMAAGKRSKRRPGIGMPGLSRIGAAMASTMVLLAPAIWNRFPLLQFDTGGYLVRWFEGYLVPSRSTVFGLYLNIFATPDFWP